MIYFAEAVGVGHVKIGFTGGEDAGKRLADLQVGSPVPLRLLGTMPGALCDERKLHQLFAAERIQGEWFRATEAVLQAIRRLLILGGSPMTVQEELTRRNNCRYGLHGVVVAVKDYGLESFVVVSTCWDRHTRLRVKVRSQDEGDVIEDLSADEVYLMASWPCRCCSPRG